MKNLLLFTLFITFILQGCGGELVYNKESPNIIQSGGKLIYKGELYSGKYIRYWDDGSLTKIEERTSYKNGVPHGESEFYHENGNLEGIGSFLNGKMNGSWRVYHENGQLKMTGSYLNGKENGVFIYWKEDGSLHSIKTY